MLGSAWNARKEFRKLCEYADELAATQMHACVKWLVFCAGNACMYKLAGFVCGECMRLEATVCVKDSAAGASDIYLNYDCDFV